MTTVPQPFEERISGAPRVQNTVRGLETSGADQRFPLVKIGSWFAAETVPVVPNDGAEHQCITTVPRWPLAAQIGTYGTPR